MEHTLVINPGSASKKYALYNETKQVLFAVFERVADGYEQCLEINGTRQKGEPVDAEVFSHPLETVVRIAKEKGMIAAKEDIMRIVVRVVAPGTFFQTHKVIDERYIRELGSKAEAAPLHAPVAHAEIEAARRVFPDATLIGASDSAFHNTIPIHARTYSIAVEDAASYDLYRFGYHGLSIASAAKRTRELFNDMPGKMVVCHIGSGVSVAALKGGVSVDTSMGFSPGSGLMMSSRCGEIDPGALIHLLSQKELSGAPAQQYIQTMGGFQGFLGTSDLRVALDRATKRDPKAVDAIDMYFYGIKKQIGASIAVLGGIDTLVLTATAPERNPLVRKLVCDGLQVFGIELDLQKNDVLVGRDGVISRDDSTTTVAVVRTHEMDEMAVVARSIL